jgi:putative transposase
MRQIKFGTGEYYHIFNRGVDKRDIFIDEKDLTRFFQSMEEFNVLKPIGSIFEASFRKKQIQALGSLAPKRGERLVEFLCYCLNPNHYHFIVQQIAERGVEKFMHRLGSGYSNYFNEKYKRTGSLFQGTFKALHIDSNEYLLHASAYVNLNNKVHGLKNVLYKSSWGEYIFGQKTKQKKEDQSFCEKEIIASQFKNVESYKKFAEESLGGMKERKELEKLVKQDE